MAKQELKLNTQAPNTLDGRQVRALAFMPAREALLDQLLGDFSSSSRRALVVGGGYSPLAQALLDRGFETTVVDPSEEAVEIARSLTPGARFMVAPSVTIDPSLGDFDLVYCADTLETHDHLDQMMGQLAKALAPGGWLILDTVADTVIAKFIYLLAFQRLPFSKIMPSPRYAASRLRNPEAIRLALRNAELSLEKIIGFETGIHWSPGEHGAQTSLGANFRPGDSRRLRVQVERRSSPTCGYLFRRRT